MAEFASTRRSPTELYTPPPQRKFTKFKFLPNMDAKQDTPIATSSPTSPSYKTALHSPSQTHPDKIEPFFITSLEYDTSMAELSDIQKEYGDTFSGHIVNIPKRRGLKAEAEKEYLRMCAQTVDTFHDRTRCLTCKQTPITTSSYSHMNHQLPLGGRERWKKLLEKMTDAKAVLILVEEWQAFVRDFEDIQRCYLENDVAKAHRAKVPWNEIVAPLDA